MTAFSKSAEVTVETLHELLSINVETGDLTWKGRGPEWFTDSKSHGLWNQRYAGGRAFATQHERGYLHGFILGRQFLAHRVVWAMVHGKWPSAQIDHINGAKSDNRPANLREASASQNQWNKGVRKDSASRSKGVYFDADRDKWVAEIRSNGRKRFLGRFADQSDAIAAYARASAELHGEFGRAA